jgi:hypothetical protein
MSATATSPTDEPYDVADATEVAHNPARREQHRQSRSPESQS